MCDNCLYTALPQAKIKRSGDSVAAGCLPNCAASSWQRSTWLTELIPHTQAVAQQQRSFRNTDDSSSSLEFCRLKMRVLLLIG
jgi:hypothetical protein